MEKLIVQPLNESKISTMIFIDTLDECEDDSTHPQQSYPSLGGWSPRSLTSNSSSLVSRSHVSPKTSVSRCWPILQTYLFSTRSSRTKSAATYRCSSKLASQNSRLVGVDRTTGPTPRTTEPFSNALQNNLARASLELYSNR